MASGNVTKLQELRPFSAASKFSSFSANVTGPPLNNRAYNGIMFNLTNPDRFILARANATRLQLPAAVYQAANKSPLGFSDSFDEIALTNLSKKIYVSIHFYINILHAYTSHSQCTLPSLHGVFIFSKMMNPLSSKSRHSACACG